MVMDVKWQKNAYILMKSDAGYLTVDSQENIRRTSYLGRAWFKIVDFLTRGKKTEQLNSAVEKTVQIVKAHLETTKQELLNKLTEIPSDKVQLASIEQDIPYPGYEKWHEVGLTIRKLFLRSDVQAPNSAVTIKSLKDLPESIRKHTQIGNQIKALADLDGIPLFFKFDFVQDPVKKEFIQNRISIYP